MEKRGIMKKYWFFMLLTIMVVFISACAQNKVLVENDEQTAEPDQSEEDMAPPNDETTVDFVITPEPPVSTEDVTITVNAHDSDGISRIRIYARGSLRKTCDDVDTCSYTSGLYREGLNIYYYALVRDASPEENEIRVPSEGSLTLTIQGSE